MPPRLAILPGLMLAGAVVTGCAGIIPAVAGEGYADPAIASGASASASEPETKAKPGRKPKAERKKRQKSPDAPVPVPAPPPMVGPAPPTAGPSPAAALETLPEGFARFVRYAQSAARDARAGADLPSALLADPVALDGKRRRCAVGEQLVAVIDLDPAGGLFAPPASPAKAPGGIALGFAMLREAGIEIAWISDLPTDRSGGVRTALEQSGLDPRGQDILSLRRDEGDTKDQRKASLGGFACIVAIAGDERPDFDARFKYLRKPEAGAALEGLIGDGWFLIEPLIGN